MAPWLCVACAVLGQVRFALEHWTSQWQQLQQGLATGCMRGAEKETLSLHVAALAPSRYLVLCVSALLGEQLSKPRPANSGQTSGAALMGPSLRRFKHAFLHSVSLHSQKKHWCEYCKVWMQDNPHSRMVHEQGVKHKEAVTRSECALAGRPAPELEDYKNKWGAARCCALAHR